VLPGFVAATRPSARRYHQYRHFWWIDVQRPERLYAMGKHGQYICVAPDADTTVVRFDWGRQNHLLAAFRAVAAQLKHRR
jgi:hypothetical protein